MARQKTKAPKGSMQEAAASDQHTNTAEDVLQEHEEVPKKRQRRRNQANPWSAAQGWRPVEVGDELILGADEFGFAGLEVLDDVTVIDPEVMESLNKAAREQLQEPSNKQGKKQQQQQQKGKQQHQQQQQQERNAPEQQAAGGKGKKRKQLDASGAAGAAAAEGEDVIALKARLQQLEAENRALKKQRKQTAAPTAAAAAAAAAEDAAAAVPADQESDSQAAAAKAAKADAKQQRKLAQKQQRLERLRQKREQQKQQKRQQQQQQQQQQQDLELEQGSGSPPVPDIDMSAWQRFDLHPQLVKALARVGFSAPTPIQDAVLDGAIRDRRDVIGAAQTGSGKTLAFGLPILQVLLQEREAEQLEQALQQELGTLADQQHEAAVAAAAAEGDDQQHDDGSTKHKQQQQQAGSKGSSSPLRALILTPTRELALQVCDHLQALGKQVGIRVVALVGGIAPVKQERLLRARPPVVVATPGRLWDLITHGASHLSHLDDLSFFVLDEADRMVQQGHYQELSSILELLPTAERFAAIAAAADAEAAAAAEAAETAAAVDEMEQRRQQARLRSQQRQQRQQQQQQQEEEEEGSSDDEGVEDDDDEGGGIDADEGGESSEGAGDESSGGEDESLSGDGLQSDEGEVDEASSDDAEQQQQQQGQKQQLKSWQQQCGAKALQPVRHHLLQTFVFSATLTLPAALHKRLRRGGGGSSGAASLESLMDRICFRPRPAIVDLSPSTRLAERVAEGVVQCLEGERDALLYYLLARHPGRALVFVNAVSAVRRVAALLQLLGLPAAALHAQQQQRQRLKALDRFKASPHGILVATDVAARGLDVPGVQMVVHYQLPASADTYIHRSGRTARTGGVDGVALALVTPSDAARWSALRKALEGQPSPPAFPVDDRVLMMAKQRVALAAKIDSVQRQDRKQHATTTWARSNADALGIELSDDSNDEGLADLRHGAIKASAAAAGSSKRGKKRARGAPAAAAAAAAGGLDTDSQVGQAGVAGARKLAQGLVALQRQLAGLLAVPLQPSISSKYFTGGVSRTAAVAAAAAASGAEAADAAAATAGQAGGAVEGGVDGEEMPQTVVPVDALVQTMQLASRLKHSRAGELAAAGGSGSMLAGAKGQPSRHGTKAAAAAAAARAAGDDGSKARRQAAALAAAAATRGGVLLPVKRGGKKRKAGQQPLLQQAAGAGKPTGLARLLMSKNELKRLKKQQGMFVVRPGSAAFGRDAQGVSALDVLTAAARR